MLNQKLALPTRSLELPIKQALAQAATMQVSGVQLDLRGEIKPASLSETGRRQLLQLLREYNLSVASTTFPLRSTLYDPIRLESRMEAIKSALLFTYQLHSRVLTIPIGTLPDTDSNTYKLLGELLNDIARWSNHVGATLSVTTTGQDPQALKALLECITEGEIGIDYDPAAVWVAGYNPIDSFRILHDRIKHTQVRDIVRQSSHTGLEVPLGRGELDWLELMALHEEAAMQNWYTLIRNEGHDQSEDLRNAVQYLNRLTMQS